MANPYDQFDKVQPQPVAAPVAVANANPYDQFDAPAAPQEKGFIGKVQDAFDRRVDNMADIGMSKDKQTGVETGAQQLGQILGLGSDTIGAGISTLIDHTAAPIVKEGARDVANMISQSPVGDAARYVGDKYHQFEEANPRAGRNIAAVGNMADAALNFLPGTKTAEKAVTVAADAIKPVGTEMLGEAIVNGTKKVGDALTPDEILSNGQVFDEARKGYKFAEDAGVQMNPNSVLNTVEKVAGEIKGKGKLTLNKPTLAHEYIDNLRNTVGKDPLSFDDIIGLDQELTDHLKGMFNPATGGYTAEGEQLRKLRQGIRDMMSDSAENPAAHIIGGDARGVQAYQDATRLWSKAINLKKAENVIERGVRTAQPATSLATGFKNLALNDKKIAGFSPAAKQAALKASEKGGFVDKIGALGSRLLPMVGLGAGGIGGYLAGEGVSTAARKLATGAQLRKANKVLQELSKSGRFIEPEAAAAKEVADTGPKLLTGPAPEILADSAGNARQATAAEAAEAAAQRQNAEQIGMTNDVRKIIGQKLQNAMKDAKSADWDKLDAATQAQVSNEISQAWDGQKETLPSLIEQAHQRAQVLAGEMGEPVQGTVVSEALKKAAQKQQMQEILKMKPREGLQALKGKK